MEHQFISLHTLGTYVSKLVSPSEFVLRSYHLQTHPLQFVNCNIYRKVFMLKGNKGDFSN